MLDWEAGVGRREGKKEREEGEELEWKTSCCPNNTTAGVKPDQMFFSILFQSYLR